MIRVNTKILLTVAILALATTSHPNQTQPVANAVQRPSALSRPPARDSSPVERTIPCC